MLSMTKLHSYQIPRHSYLLTQTEAAEMTKIWHNAAYEEIRRNIGNQVGFPCVFARNAFRKKLLKFAFVEDTCSCSIARLAMGLAEYVKISENWDNDLNTATP